MGVVGSLKSGSPELTTASCIPFPENWISSALNPTSTCLMVSPVRASWNATRLRSSTVAAARATGERAAVDIDVANLETVRHRDAEFMLWRRRIPETDHIDGVGFGVRHKQATRLRVVRGIFRTGAVGVRECPDFAQGGFFLPLGCHLLLPPPLKRALFPLSLIKQPKLPRLGYTNMNFCARAEESSYPYK